VFDYQGNIYGTTTVGGEDGNGTVFAFAHWEILTWNFGPLWSFNGTSGSQPYGSLTLDRAGNLYGTTTGGGSNGAGVVFQANAYACATKTTPLTSSPNPSTYGQAVTLTARVWNPGCGTPPDGEAVAFEHDGTLLGTGALSGGWASFTTSTLNAGTTSITAIYGGDWNYVGSTSKAVKQVVGKATTTTALISSQNPSNFGQSVTLTASVTPQFSGTPTGLVKFINGEREVGDCTAFRRCSQLHDRKVSRRHGADYSGL